MKRIEVCIRPMVSVLHSRDDGKVFRKENLDLIRCTLKEIAGDDAGINAITINRKEKTVTLRFEEINIHKSYGIIDKLQARGLSSRLIV